MKYLKLWFSRERKKLLKWNKKNFLVLQVLYFRLKKQTSKNVADAAFKDALVMFCFVFIKFRKLKSRQWEEKNSISINLRYFYWSLYLLYGANNSNNNNNDNNTNNNNNSSSNNDNNDNKK